MNYRDGVAYPVNDIGYYSMDQTTQEPIFLGGGIYELPDYEQLSAMRNDPESGEKYSFVRVFSVSGTAAIHFGMADPVSVENSSGDSVNIARFILGAGVQGTPVDVHPVSGKDPEKWKRNARGYNSVFALYRTMAGFAQHVKDRWGEESQYASQAWNDLGTNLKGRIEGTRDLFVPVEE